MNAEHTIVVDLGYGDAGKGTVVDWLCATAATAAVIRFNGGAQAGHNVVTPDGRHHTFSQFGAGTLLGVPTHLSRFTIVDPLCMAIEADALAAIGVPDPFGLLTVDGGALLTTPWHRAANRLRERRRGAARHGSCGRGVGETVAYALAEPDTAPRVGDARSAARLRGRLTAVRDRLSDELGELDGPPVGDTVEAFLAFGERVSIVDGAAVRRQLLRGGRCVFEGAQGVLLDEWRGWHPFTTWSTTTFDNAEALLAEAGQPGAARRLGVVRAYTTRHGPGPFVAEDAGLGAALPDPHNGDSPWQGGFRIGHFDAPAHRYAVEVAGGVHGLAVTHLDVVESHPALTICRSYQLDESTVDRIVPGEFGDLSYQEKLTGWLSAARPVYDPAPPPDWATAIGATLGAPVLVESRGPTRAEKTSV